MQLALYFCLVSFGVLVTNAFARQIAGKLMQVKREGQTLLTTHLLVTPDLFLHCVLGLHGRWSKQRKRPQTTRRADTEPTLRLVTRLTLVPECFQFPPERHPVFLVVPTLRAFLS